MEKSRLRSRFSGRMRDCILGLEDSASGSTLALLHVIQQRESAQALNATSRGWRISPQICTQEFFWDDSASVENEKFAFHHHYVCTWVLASDGDLPKCSYVGATVPDLLIVG